MKKIIQRNGSNYFPCGSTFCSILSFFSYFQPFGSDAVYKVSAKDFGKRVLTGVNVENPSDTVTLAFESVVNHYKKF